MIQTMSGRMNFNTRFASSNQNFSIAFIEKPKVFPNLQIASDVSANVTNITQTGFTLYSSDHDRQQFVGWQDWEVLAIGRWK